MKRTYGQGDDDYISRKKNAFRFPKDPQAEFPKHDAPVYIDKRSGYVAINLRQRAFGNSKVSKVEAERQKVELEDALINADKKFYANEKGHIDLSKMQVYDNMDIDNELNEINKINKKNKKVKKDKIINNDDDIDEAFGMDIDENVDASSNIKKEKSVKTVRSKNKKTGKTKKSYYIVS